ncbi:MAG: hypothetical protein ABI534_02380 [Chloroflexota bacterium]
MRLFSIIPRIPVRVLLPFVLLAAFAGRLRQAWRSRPTTVRAARERSVLPSLYSLHPHASAALRRPRGLEPVALDEIVGTARRPSQNTADFLPLPQLRGQNWRGRWQRIRRATDRLDLLPPVELLRYGDEYFVVDGHNRIAAAKRLGAVAIDADVTELVPPGEHAHSAPPATIAATLEASDELRHAVLGRQSRTAEHRPHEQQVSRLDLLRASGDNPRPAGEATEVHPTVDAPDEPG